MTQPPDPVDTFQLLSSRPDDPANIRMLRFAVLGMGLILVMGFGVVIARIVYLTTRAPAVSSGLQSSVSQPAVSQPSDGRSLTGQRGGTLAVAGLAAQIGLALPAGSKVRSHTLSANRLSVHYETAGADGIVILDLETGQPISRILITNEKQ